MAQQRLGLTLSVLLFLVAAAMALSATGKMATTIPPQIVVNRTTHRDVHLEVRHGTSALAALLAVRVCPEPFALFCHSDFFRTEAIAIGCRSEDGRCAFCIVGLDGSLKTCYIRRHCDLPCDPIPMPHIEFPAVCAGSDISVETGCLPEDNIRETILYLNSIPEEIPNVCTE